MIPVFVAIDRIKNLEGESRQIFCSRHLVEQHGLVAGQAGQKIGNRGVAAIDQEGMIPNFDHVLHGELFHFGKVHHHAVVGLPGSVDDVAPQGDFDDIAMAMQMTALALMVGDAVAGVEFEAASDLHGGHGNQGVAKYSLGMGQLSTFDHSRDSAGMTYVYPVVSRRAGGVSVGINLNPNNACNWRCSYCQVPNLRCGGPPAIDLAKLEAELHDMLHQLYVGDFLQRHAPPEAQRVVDVAFSGNGEPTSAAEFADAVTLVGRVIEQFALQAPPRLRLITNGSLLDRAGVQRGIAQLGRLNGEVWFKLDALSKDSMRQINGVAYAPKTVLRRLRACCALAETWVQTCIFAIDGQPSLEADIPAYLDLLSQAEGLKGVHLYGLARQSMQPEASRLAGLESGRIENLAKKIETRTGLVVKVSL